MRVIKNGVQLTVSGSPYGIVTPDATAGSCGVELCAIRRFGNDRSPELCARRFGAGWGDTSWTLTAITYSPSITAPTGLALDHSAGTTTYYKVTAVKAETFEESEPTAEIGLNQHGYSFAADGDFLEHGFRGWGIQRIQAQKRCLWVHRIYDWPFVYG
jgi:hypothetical protein